MPPQDSSSPRRGFFLQFMHNFYAVYLGVTPPSPENEKRIAAIVVGGIVFVILFLFFLARFILSSLFST